MYVGVEWGRTQEFIPPPTPGGYPESILAERTTLTFMVIFCVEPNLRKTCGV